MTDNQRFAFMLARQRCEQTVSRLAEGDGDGLDRLRGAASFIFEAAFECFASPGRKAGRAASSDQLDALMTGLRKSNEEMMRAFISTPRRPS